MSWLADLPIWTLLPGAMALGLLLTAVGTYVTTALAGRLAIEGATRTAIWKYEFIGQIYAVLLGFLLAGEAARYDDLRLAVRREAASIAQLAEIASSLPPVAAARVRGGVAAYADALIEAEWPLLERAAKDARSGTGAPEATRALAALNLLVVSIDPGTGLEGARLRAIRDQATAQTRAIEGARDDRLARSAGTLSPLMRFVLLATTGAVLIFTWFFGQGPIGTRILLGGLVAGIILVEVVAVLRLGQPFAGDIAIRPFGLESLRAFAPI